MIISLHIVKITYVLCVRSKFHKKSLFFDIIIKNNSLVMELPLTINSIKVERDIKQQNYIFKIIPDLFQFHMQGVFIIRLIPIFITLI